MGSKKIALLSTSFINDSELGNLLSKGDETAFRHLYDEYWNRIYLLALNYLKSSELAQDVVQDVFFKVWDQREIFSTVKHPGSFIYVMGRNAVINAFRKKLINDRVVEEFSDYIPNNFQLPNQILEIKQLQQRLDSAINCLPPQQSRIIKLSREGGLTHKEIAERLSIEKSTVKNHIIRALNTLRQQLQLIRVLAVGFCASALHQIL